MTAPMVPGMNLKLLNDNYSLHDLTGSSCLDHRQDPPRSAVVHIDDLFTYLSQAEVLGSVDVSGIFGGEPVLANCVSEGDWHGERILI